MHNARPLVAMALAGALGLTLSGCGGSEKSSATPPAAVGSPVSSGSAQSPVSSGSAQSPASSGSAQSPASTVSVPAGGQTAPGAASPSQPSPPASSAPTGGSSSGQAEAVACSTHDLDVSLTPGEGAGAGSLFPYLVLTNSSSATCTVRGYPGVSFVGYGNGTQLGAAGLRVDLASLQTVTLSPGQSSHSKLRIARAENFPADTCSPVAADGLRVYPPEQTAALYAPSDEFTACADESVKLIMVGPMEPGAA
ncbi:Protein of unknown function [Propionibacterium cyclohexanicum]|uniref:DUF4232 domain-containing protein n=2 Tax=Propionibacterium cyclohexanicum TaxID=64702 RepID=A0A1H9TCV8_9ACTN|nr:Protein of unknown function [Propionibacterium cyclohexanicum]